MTQELKFPEKERKVSQSLAKAAMLTDKDIRIIKLPELKIPNPPAIAPDPFSTWKMPPQQDGYLKSNHNDCL